MVTSESFIICDSLVKIFKVGDVEILALQGLDITIRKGELVGIVGASGSGKTTLMNVLGGLVRPSAGQALVAGQNLLKLSAHDLTIYRRQQVGFVWQQGSRNLIPYLSALDNIKFPMTLAGQAGSKADKRARDLMDMVGLENRYDHKPIELSGGEQQRVAIAIALANQPNLLLADEPTGELDSATAEQVYSLFQRLNDELGLTIIIVSHDPDIARHVKRVVAIRDGKLSSETVRRRDANNVDTPEQFEELIVLDSAGRLQIPKAYREQLAIQNRVEMEVKDKEIIIRKPQNIEDTSSQQEVSIERSHDVAQESKGLLAKLLRWKK